MKKHLLTLGDVRIGDCFHVGAYLNKLKYEYETVWMHGPYERKAVNFLKDHCNLNIVSTIEQPSSCFRHTGSGIPSDLNSIINFIQDHYDKEYAENFELVTSNPDPIFFDKNDNVVYETKNLPAGTNETDYIVIHSSSISNWKNHNILNTLPVSTKVYGVGEVGEKIPNNSIDMRGLFLSEIAAIMKKSKCVVGIHSSMACLAFHLGVPLIACHFGDGGGGQIKFSDYRENCIDIVNPTKDSITAALRTFGVE